jgi:hypothetical protein
VTAEAAGLGSERRVGHRLPAALRAADHLHPPEQDHALEDVDRAARAVALDAEQVVDILRYAITGEPA